MIEVMIEATKNAAVTIKLSDIDEIQPGSAGDIGDEAPAAELGVVEQVGEHEYALMKITRYLPAHWNSLLEEIDDGTEFAEEAADELRMVIADFNEMITEIMGRDNS